MTELNEESFGASIHRIPRRRLLISDGDFITDFGDVAFATRALTPKEQAFVDAYCECRLGGLEFYPQSLELR